MSAVEAYYDRRLEEWSVRVNGVPLNVGYPTQKRAEREAERLADRHSAVLRVLTKDGSISRETAKYRLTMR